MVLVDAPETHIFHPDFTFSAAALILLLPMIRMLFLLHSTSPNRSAYVICFIFACSSLPQRLLLMHDIKLYPPSVAFVVPHRSRSHRLTHCLAPVNSTTTIATTHPTHNTIRLCPSHAHHCPEQHHQHHHHHHILVFGISCLHLLLPPCEVVRFCANFKIESVFWLPPIATSRLHPQLAHLG